MERGTQKPGKALQGQKLRPSRTRNKWRGAPRWGWVVCRARAWVTTGKNCKHPLCFSELWPSLLPALCILMLENLRRRKPSGFSQFPSPYNSMEGLIGLQIREPHSQDSKQNLRIQWKNSECLWLNLKKNMRKSSFPEGRGWGPGQLSNPSSRAVCTFTLRLCLSLIPVHLLGGYLLSMC